MIIFVYISWLGWLAMQMSGLVLVCTNIPFDSQKRAV